MIDLDKAELAPQSFGIAMAQCVYGGPTGIWLNCMVCNRSDVIKGSNSDEWAKAPNADAAKVFVRHGWTGQGSNLMNAKCPKCSEGANK